MSVLTKNVVSAVAFLDKPIVLSRLLNVRPDDESFVQTMRMLGRYLPASATEEHFFVDTPLFKTNVIQNLVDNSGTNMTDITLTFDAGHGIIPGHILMFQYGDVGYVKSVNNATNEVNVVAIPQADGTVNGMTVSAGDVAVILSQASGEGSEGATPRYVLPKRYSYRLQIFKSAREITDIQHASPIEFEVDGQPYITYLQEMEGLLELMAYVSMGLLYNPETSNQFTSGTPGLTDDQGRPVNVTRGLEDWIVTGGGISGSNVTVNTSFFATLTKSLNAAGAGSDYLIVGGTEAMVAIDDTIKALNGAILQNARFSVDGRTVDLDLESFRLYQRRYTKKHLGLFDMPTHFNLNVASANHDKDMFFIPLDDAAVTGSGSRVPRISVMYLPLRVTSGVNRFYSADKATMTTFSGQLAPGGATNNKAVLRFDYSTYCGLRVAGVEHFAKYSVA
ncbi:MAG: hypothetical protein D6790_19215 [Caldilineae bacterium]|nr:MAG: hypothetical protein D6790_19215 [Caldilineae bacterium]